MVGISMLTKSAISISSIVSILLFIFFYSPTLIPFLHKTTTPLELKELLREASMETRTVIVTVIEDNSRAGSDIIHGSPSTVENFLDMLRDGETTKHLVNHLVVLTLDPRSFRHCKSVHPHCFFLEYRGRRELYKATLKRRNEFLVQVLELGYNLFFTDVGLLWWKNPLPMFGGEDHISIGCEFWKQRREYFYLKSGARSIHLFKLWKLFSFIHPQTQNSSLCELRYNEELGSVINKTTIFIPSQTASSM